MIGNHPPRWAQPSGRKGTMVGADEGYDRSKRAQDAKLGLQ